MKILIDIGHPAHVHFFREPVRILAQRGHDILVTSRRKDCAEELLGELGIKHLCLSAQGRAGLVGLAWELVSRDWALARAVRVFRPDVMTAIGGTFVAQVGWTLRVPSVVFYDTENARLQNAITYPFASVLVVPRCYRGWVPAGRDIRYPGYHELSYLHPARFHADRLAALRNGLSAEGDTFLIRLVAWRASHDVGDSGIGIDLLRGLIATLGERGKVLISAEGRLPGEFATLQYEGKKSELHHVMAYCRAYVGESATMASECAVLGVPAVYAASTGRGYTDEQEARYGLVRNVRHVNGEALGGAVNWALSRTRAETAEARARLLADTIDVASFAADCVEQYAFHGLGAAASRGA